MVLVKDLMYVAKRGVGELSPEVDVIEPRLS